MKARLILEVWKALGGGDLRGDRGRAFWRNGEQNSVRVTASKNVWFDNGGEGASGGIVDLVATVLGISNREAGKWIADRYAWQGREVQPWIDPKKSEAAELWRVGALDWIESELAKMSEVAEPDEAEQKRIWECTDLAKQLNGLLDRKGRVTDSKMSELISIHEKYQKKAPKWTRMVEREARESMEMFNAAIREFKERHANG